MYGTQAQAQQWCMQDVAMWLQDENALLFGEDGEASLSKNSGHDLTINSTSGMVYKQYCICRERNARGIYGNARQPQLGKP